MIPWSSLLANRNNSCPAILGELQIPRGHAKRRLSCEHCVNTSAVGRICCVELTAPQCKVSPPYIPRSRKIHSLHGTFTWWINATHFNTAVKEERTDLYPSRCFCFPFAWLASTNGMFVSVFSVSLQFGFPTRILLKFQFAYVKITHIVSIWHNIQRTNWRCQYYILYLWIRHTTHRFGFTCLKIFILLIYSIF